MRINEYSANPLITKTLRRIRHSDHLSRFRFAESRILDFLFGVSNRESGVGIRRFGSSRGFTPLQKYQPYRQGSLISQLLKRRSRLTDHSDFVTGFTMVEIVIILGIIVMISSILLANFPSFSRSINLQRSSQQLGLAFRRTQSMALAVREVDLGGGINGLLSGHHIPRSYGIYINLSSSQTSYIIFGDFNAGGGTVGVYDPVNDFVVETGVLVGNGTFMSGMSINPLGAAENTSVLHITFNVPSADMNIKLPPPSSVTPQSAQVVLRNQADLLGPAKTVTVVTTGQISLK